MVKPASTGVMVQPTAISSADITALLQQSGMLSQASTGYRRMRLTGGILYTLDAQGEVEDMFPPKMEKGVTKPSLTVRIVEPPIYYNSFWFDRETDDKGRVQGKGVVDPNRIGRPDLMKNFSKKYDDPEKQATLANSDADKVFDQIAEATGKRGDFKADVQVQIVPESGEMTGEETIYTLTLSGTAALDWRGTRKNPTGGVAQEKNFIVQLAELAVSEAVAAGADANGQGKAVLDAMTSLRLGGVVAEIYLISVTSDDGSMTWTIPAFKPVHIEPATGDAPALTATTGGDIASDDIGF